MTGPAVPQIAPQIAIVGGGFTGAAVALYLLQKTPSVRASIEIFEPGTVLGAGLAYATPDPEHRINVAAARMALFSDDPTHFDRWFHLSGEIKVDPRAVVSEGRTYPRRAVFARYVDGLLRAAAREADQIEFRHTRRRVEQIARSADGYRLRLEGNETRRADLVVLAVGHPTPALPKPLRAVAGHLRLIGNPWPVDALQPIRPTDRILIVGTGLTMGDVVASLRARGHEGAITAVSRRGLTPRPRTAGKVEPLGDFAREPARTVSTLLRQVRVALRDAKAAGRPWEDVVDALRQQATAIWRALPAPEKHRFLRHLRPYWDAHRYQAAPQIDGLVVRERQKGGLQILAASLQSVAPDGDGFQVALRPRGQAETVTERFDAIVNCTGPAHDSVVRANPALASLAGAGALQADEFGLGIETDLEARVIDRDGTPNETLLVVGPLARSAYGELMGLPQVSWQTHQVAEQVAEWLGRSERQLSSPRIPAPSVGAPERRAAG
ncbi:hydroxyacylglutathione hydrolase [Hypericibacter adhaerens]|uniref:Hydroxyacylglutathione hydrolase n=1 Tax=Hypericibacter adhaerens TaxID=2602016 RepID=A0A5J6N054_9PROT|nr:FAD/NAD(P)-binding protein [Hypericibacter adhaerens]QEX20266.1 hydroxyacylglutathione hydrolase [Hypericibacter adhaerens]